MQEAGGANGIFEDRVDSRLSPVAYSHQTLFFIGSFLPLVQSLLHLGFRIDAEGVGHPVDVVEIGDHLHRVEDVPVVQRVQAEVLQILRANSGWSASEQLGEFA